MGSKHRPPRWWLPSLDEEKARWDAAARGRQEQLVAFQMHQVDIIHRAMFGHDPIPSQMYIIEPNPNPPPQVEWTVHELDVNAIHRMVSNQPSRAVGDPIASTEAIKLGERVVFASMFGGYSVGEVTELDLTADPPTFALRSGGSIWWGKRGRDHWGITHGANLDAIKKLEFTEKEP